MSAVLVVAKSPVPGLAKTRLARGTGRRDAAELAAAACLDVLDAALATGLRVVVAWSGRLAAAAERRAIESALRQVPHVVPQVGRTFGARLCRAHQDAHRLATGPVVQIGTDTPQVTAALLVEAVRRVGPERAVLGAAADGGWWALGLPAPAAASALADVPMSRSDTGPRTRAAVRATGLAVEDLACLRDVDDLDDARWVAGMAPDTRFAHRLAELGWS